MTVAPTSAQSTNDRFEQAVRAAIDAAVPATLRIGDEQFDLSAEQLSRLTAPPSDRIEVPDYITTGQAADLLGVTRPTVVALIDRGELDAVRVGTHRRLRSEHVVRYRDGVSEATSAGLDELVELSDELGLYD